MISAEGHRGRPLICLLIRLRTSNGCGRISALRYTQRLADLAGPSINEYEFQSGCTANYLDSNMGETARRRPTGIRPLRQVLAAPGGDAGPLARSAPANSNVLARFLAGEVRAAARSPVHRRENLKVVSFAANSRATMAIWAAGVGALSRPPLAGPAGKSFTIILAIFPEFLPLASCRRRPAGSRTVRPAAVIRPARGPGAQARAAPRHDRHGPNPRPPAQIRSNVPRGATRSSTARYFILHRIKVT